MTLPRIKIGSLSDDKNLDFFLYNDKEEIEFSIHCNRWDVYAYAWINGNLFALRDVPPGFYPLTSPEPFYAQDNYLAGAR